VRGITFSGSHGLRRFSFRRSSFSSASSPHVNALSVSTPFSVTGIPPTSASDSAPIATSLCTANLLVEQGVLPSSGTEEPSLPDESSPQHPSLTLYDGPDFISQLPRDIGKVVLSYLDFKDLCSMQATCQSWYRLGSDPSLWYSIVISKCWRQAVQSLFLREMVDWKDVCRHKWRLRSCLNCKRTFRECENTIDACLIHVGVRELFTNRRHPGPSGVYWSCCGKKEKDALGCHRSRHIESSSKELEGSVGKVNTAVDAL